MCNVSAAATERRAGGRGPGGARTVRAGAGERSGKREREIGGRHTQNGQWIYGALTSRLERDAADMETKNSSGRVATPVSVLIAERDLLFFRS